MACVIAAPKSGSGKTLLSILLASWARCHGLSLQAFKAGPDFLDPQLLKKVSGNPCRNLDLFLSGADWVFKTFNTYGALGDLALVEGVMGLFDGIGSTNIGSTASLAKKLNLPIVFVVDAQGQAASLASLIKGFRDEDPELNFAGIVLNNIKSTRHKELLSEVITGIDMKMLGCLPKTPELNIPSENLGLIPVHEVNQISDRIKVWGELADSNLNMEFFIKLLKPPLKSKFNHNNLSIEYISNPSKNNDFPVAIAQDKAFHFQYQDTKDFLEASGISLIPWRPLHDEPIPSIAKGLIIPGGYPEKYAQELSNCNRSLNALKMFYNKHPIYAECGGMLLLGKSIEDQESNTYQMAGILPFSAKKSKLEVGYRNLIGTRDSLLIKNQENLVGHEFHRWRIEIAMKTNINNHKNIKHQEKDNFQAPWKIQGWKTKAKLEGWSTNMLHASWIHLHWPSNPKLIERWKGSLNM